MAAEECLILQNSSLVTAKNAAYDGRRKNWLKVAKLGRRTKGIGGLTCCALR